MQNCLLKLGLALDLEDGRALVGNTLSTTLAHGLVLDAASLHLVGEVLGTKLLGLGLMDVLHQNALVLEGVTLCLEVKGVVTISSATCLWQPNPDC